VMRGRWNRRSEQTTNDHQNTVEHTTHGVSP
jgi:hypothetical protein